MMKLSWTRESKESRKRGEKTGEGAYIMNELSGPCAFYGHVNY